MWRSLTVNVLLCLAYTLGLLRGVELITHWWGLGILVLLMLISMYITERR